MTDNSSTFGRTRVSHRGGAEMKHIAGCSQTSARLPNQEVEILWLRVCHAHTVSTKDI